MMIRRQPARRYGFTLLEVMIALAILSITLVGLIGRTARNVRISYEMGMLDVATDLARSKMYDIEAELLEEGFPETEKEDDGDFDEQGWPDIKWSVVIEKVELPNLGAMEALKDGEGEGGEDGEPGGALGGLLGGLGGGVLGGGGLGGKADGAGGMDMSAASGLIGSQFELFKQVLEVSIRKVTLKLEWYGGMDEQDMVVVCYFTDPYAMNRVISGLPLPDANSNSPSTPPRSTTPPRSKKPPRFSR